jgi:single-strand DNA-binding protein
VRLATKERGYTLQNGTQVPDRTDWHTIRLWNNLAKIVERYVHTGDKLYIEGRIRYVSYDDKKGQRHYTTEIYAENLELLSPKPTVQPQQSTPSQQESQKSEEEDDGMPF